MSPVLAECQYHFFILGCSFRLSVFGLSCTKLLRQGPGLTEAEWSGINDYRLLLREQQSWGHILSLSFTGRSCPPEPVSAMQMPSHHSACVGSAKTSHIVSTS